MMRLRPIFVTIVISILVSLLIIDSESEEKDGHAVVEDVQQGIFPAHAQFQSSSDTMSLMQGTNIRVELLGTMSKDASRPNMNAPQEPLHKRQEQVKEQNIIPSAGKTPESSHGDSKLYEFKASLKSHVRRLRASMSEKRQVLLELAASRLSTKSAAPFVFLMLFLVCTCIIVGLVVGTKGASIGRAPNPSPQPGVLGPPGREPSEVLPQRQPFSASGAGTFSRTPAFTGSDLQPQATSHAGIWQSISRPSSVMTGLSVPGLFRSGPTPTQESLVANTYQSPERPMPPSFAMSGQSLDTGGKSVPPPLCPTLVLPVCEARFGVNMEKLALLTNEGEIDIVGLSGNPLLRAAVRKVHAGRRLEISMPEAGSAPRATVGPAAQGTRSLELRALKGAFYGMLEMRNTGACYVVKDGSVVLTIDGDTDSLQLSIKSGQGVSLASVRCSTEFLGGVDHVEVRVEPGVDTVLVLSCVLSVLLLSPFPPPA
jgi:hypothetical protein